MIVALELVDLITGEILCKKGKKQLNTLEYFFAIILILTAHFWLLVRSISAVVSSVAEVRLPHADVIVALEFVLLAVLASVETRRAVPLVGQVSAVPVAVALELGLDTVTAVTLEAVCGAFEVLAVDLVRPISTIIVVVAAPPLRNALVISTFEF